jgi:hypothetical protein
MFKEDHETLEALHNKYVGEPLYVLATGPSMKKLGDGINVLADKYTFGVNYLMKMQSLKFVPTFYGASEIDFMPYVDPLVRDFTHQPKFLSSMWATDQPGWTWIYLHYLRDMRERWFAGLDENFHWAANGWGVVFDCAVQVGCWMGFDPIYLLGVDATNFGHGYIDDDDPSDRQRKRTETTVLCAEIACGIMEGRGRSLINLTEGGNLTIPRMTLQEALEVERVRKESAVLATGG